MTKDELLDRIRGERALFDRMIGQQGEPERLTWFGREVPRDEFLQIMRDEGRVIYEFEPMRVYGMYGEIPS